MGELLTRYRSLRAYLDACVTCSACTDKCHYFLGTKDPKNMPVRRHDLMHKAYRRYFTLAGRLFLALVGGAGPDPRGPRRVVQLFPPMLTVPPLLGLLPLWYRYRRDLHGGALITNPPKAGRPMWVCGRKTMFCKGAATL